MSDDMPLHFSSNSSSQSDHPLPTKIAKLEARMVGKASSAATVASSGGSGAAIVAIAAPSPALQQQQQQQPPPPPPPPPQQQQQPPPPPPPQQQQPAWSPVVSSSVAKFVADELAEPSTSSDSDDDDPKFSIFAPLINEILSLIRRPSQSVTNKEQSSRPGPLVMCMNIMKEMGFSVKHQMIMWHYFAAHPQVQRTFCQLSDDDRRGIIASVVKSQSPAAD